MTEESILHAMRKEMDALLPALGNGMSYEDFLDAVIELAREAMRKARREALRGN